MDIEQGKVIDMVQNEFQMVDSQRSGQLCIFDLSIKNHILFRNNTRFAKIGYRHSLFLEAFPH